MGPPGPPTLVALTSAMNPVAAIDVMKSPPRLPSFAPNLLARTLRLGLLGELRATGAHARGRAHRQERGRLGSGLELSNRRGALRLKGLMNPASPNGAPATRRGRTGARP